jgi:transcriptional regulator with XRE-family HTH domain
MPHRASDPIRIPPDFWDRDTVTTALRTRDIGTLIRLLRRHTGASQTQIGIAVGLDQAYISRIVHGRKVTTIDLLERIADGLHLPNTARTTLGLAPSHEPRAGTHPTRPHDSRESNNVSWRNTLDRTVDDWRGDMERRNVLRCGAFSAASYAIPALRWFTSDGPTPPRNAGYRAVGQPDVEAIREMTSTFRRIDNQYGGGHSHATVARYLHDEVAPLLRDGRFDEATGRALLSATAETTHVAGWMSFDAGRHATAQRYLINALDLARIANDRPLGAEILAAMSHQATHLDDATTALDLARAAGRTAQRAGVRVLVAEAAVMEAHAFARSNDARSCASMLSRAERELDQADRSRDPRWLSYFDAAHMSAKFGHCFHELGQNKQAERFAARSLQMDNHYVRGRTFNLLLLASVHAQKGDHERACVLGEHALTLMARLRSVRAVEYLRALQQQLIQPTTSPMVRRFNARATDALARAGAVDHERSARP